MDESNGTTSQQSQHADNIEVVDDVEVIFAPNFSSDSPHEVLGCDVAAEPKDIERRYRDLSRKYHPDRSDNPSISSGIFQIISQAYARLTQKTEVPSTEEDAKRAYEEKFGKYRELYYNEGGMIGIPYSSDLKEKLEKTKYYRDLFSVSLCRVGIKRVRVSLFRTWLIKKNMNAFLWCCEVLLTWAVIALCVLAFLLEKDQDIWPELAENNGQIINIAGGVALMFAEFILVFWYGFSRYPAGNVHFIEWLCRPLDGESAANLPPEDQDMDDIRAVCSYYLHNDKARRFHPIIVSLCFPIVLVEQFLASIAYITARCFLCLCQDDEDISYVLHLSKSMAALMVVIGHYVLWMYGNNFCKLAGAASLIVSQNLYSAVLFEKSLFEFLQSFLLGNTFLVTLQVDPRVREKVAVEAKKLSHDRMDENDKTFDSEDTSFLSGAQDTKSSSAGAANNFGDEEKDGIHSKKTCIEADTQNRDKDLETRTSFHNDQEDAAYVAAAKAAAMSKTTVYVKSSSFSAPPKRTRSLQPLAALRSSTWFTRSAPPPISTTDREMESVQENDNVSLDLSYIDRGEIETFVEDGHQRDPTPPSNTRSLNAEEILEDLAVEESSNVSISAASGAVGVLDGADGVEESNNMLSVYKATKRRIEEAFYSAKVHVEQNIDIAESKSVMKRDGDFVATTPSGIDRNFSFNFMPTEGEESALQKDSEEGFDTQLPPMIQVINTVDKKDVEIDDHGYVVQEGRELDTAHKDIEKGRKTLTPKNEKKKWRGFFSDGGEKKSDDEGKVEPPIKHIDIQDMRPNDDDLTRSGIWEESFTNSIAQSKRNIHKSRQYPYPKPSFDEGGDLYCACADDLLP